MYAHLLTGNVDYDYLGLGSSRDGASDCKGVMGLTVIVKKSDNKHFALKM